MANDTLSLIKQSNVGDNNSPLLTVSKNSKNFRKLPQTSKQIKKSHSSPKLINKQTKSTFQSSKQKQQQQHKLLPIEGFNQEAANFLSKGAQVILRMRGLPFTCTPKQVVDFFATTTKLKQQQSQQQLDQHIEQVKCNVFDGENGVLFVKNSNNKPTGDAFVLFESEKDAQKALSKHKHTIGVRYIELFLSSSSELQQVLNLAAQPQQQQQQQQHQQQSPSTRGEFASNRNKDNKIKTSVAGEKKSEAVTYAQVANKVFNKSSNDVQIEGKKGSDVNLKLDANKRVSCQRTHSSNTLVSDTSGAFEDNNSSSECEIGTKLLNDSAIEFEVTDNNIKSFNQTNNASNFQEASRSPSSVSSNINSDSDSSGYKADSKASTTSSSSTRRLKHHSDKQQQVLNDDEDDGSQENTNLSHCQSDNREEEQHSENYQQIDSSINYPLQHTYLGNYHNFVTFSQQQHQLNHQHGQHNSNQQSHQPEYQQPFVYAHPDNYFAIAEHNRNDNHHLPHPDYYYHHQQQYQHHNHHHQRIQPPANYTHPQGYMFPQIYASVHQQFTVNSQQQQHKQSDSEKSNNTYQTDVYNQNHGNRNKLASRRNQQVLNCAKLRGLPYEASVEHILDFLGSQSCKIAFHGIHMVYSAQGQPSGEALVQMDSEESVHETVRQCHKKEMSVGKKCRYIEVIPCSMNDLLLASSIAPVPTAAPSLSSSSPIHQPYPFYIRHQMFT